MSQKGAWPRSFEDGPRIDEDFEDDGAHENMTGRSYSFEHPHEDGNERRDAGAVPPGSGLGAMGGAGVVNYIPGRGAIYAVVKERTIIFTPMVSIVCVCLMIWEFSVNDWKIEPLAMNPSIGVSVETMIHCGAKDYDLIVHEGQWWRLFSAFFLHAGLIHIAFNLMAYHNLSSGLERSYGTIAACVIFVTSGYFSTVSSAIFSQNSIMVGASGAIFGVFGCAWSDLFQNWRLHTNKASTVMSLTLMTAVNVILGFMPYLDQFAHLGGMIMGFVLGFFFCVLPAEDSNGTKVSKRPYQRVLQVLSAVGAPTLVIIATVALYNGWNPSETCSWCPKMSCLEVPPNDPWWRCDSCSVDGYSAMYYQNGTTILTCPDETVISTTSCAGTSQNDLLQCCIDQCL